MSVTGLAPADREARFLHVNKLAGSSVLHGSESLCKLLRYLAENSLEHPGASVKEYQIATEVFGRPSDFDPRLDSTVRVQTGRLRGKLAEYYAGEGADDQMIVELPKGSYALTFHSRPSPEPMSPAPPPASVAVPLAVPARGELPAVAIPRQPSRTLLAVMVVVLAIFAAGLGAFLTLALNRTRSAGASQISTASDPGLAGFQRLWKGFIDTSELPWVVFSNAEFVGRPEKGMRYFNPAVDSREHILDHYTGVGEVLAMHDLDRLFMLLRHEIRVKRSRLLSLDDVKNNDLIFVGSPSENLPLREFPTTRNFIFRPNPEEPRKGDLAIVNLSPRANEAALYMSSAKLPITEDYAVIALVPGLNPTRWVMILAGTTTIGTQAAVEFVCRSPGVEELMRRANPAGKAPMPPFEAVVRVKVAGGVPVQSQLVALRTDRD